MKKDVMSGPRKFGCDMCARGQRMLEYIEELETELEEVKSAAKKRKTKARKSVGDSEEGVEDAG